MEDTQEISRANRFSFLGFEAPKAKGGQQGIETLLKKSKTIAIVGLSDKRTRDSFMVAEYLLGAGYTIIPVNPMIKQWEGIESYPSLSAIPEETRIDIVDIFRNSDAVPALVDEALLLKQKPACIWMQLGVENNEAAQKAEAAGIMVVQNRCLKIEHLKLGF